MGKRKERRLAAKIGAGRRVKLDLFADPPSGDLGGSSAKDEVGNHVDAKPDPELPSSPSSGLPTENPLSLLGQYSDDELDELSNDKVIPPNVDNQAKELADEQLEEGEVSGNEDVSFQKTEDQGQESDSTSAIDVRVTTHDDITTSFVTSVVKSDGAIRDSVSLPSSLSQSTGNVNSSWKMVLHEESNSYYYWNTVTGETSWAVPGNMVEETVLTNGLENLGKEVEESSEGEQAALQCHAFEQCKDESDKLLGISSGVGRLPYEASGHFLLPDQYSSGMGGLTMDGYDVHGHGAMTTEHGVDFPSNLMKHCHVLLERLHLLLGSGSDVERSAWLSNYASEIEVRLCDIRALLPYGSSLAPFWLHSERQINQLENAINAVTGKQAVESRAMHLNCTELKEAKLDGRGEKLKVDGDLMKLSPPGVMLDTDATAVIEKPLYRQAPDGSLKTPQMFASEPTAESHLGESGRAETNVVDRKATSPEVEVEVEVGMDIDMDVDMDVEVPSPTGTRDNDAEVVLLAQSVQPSAHLSGQCASPETEVVLPPPEEDWIPPPPPDNDGIPPPPPDEPPESLFIPPPPSEPEPEQEPQPVSMPMPGPTSESLQSIYGEQYNLACAESNVNFYGNTSLVSSGNNFYEQVNDSQIAAVNLPVCYAAASNPQPATLLTPANAVIYYGLQNGASPVLPLPDSIRPSSTQATASNLIIDAPLASEIASVGASTEECSMAKVIADPSATSGKFGAFPSQVSVAATIAAPATASVKERASVSSFSAAATSSTSMSTLTAVADASAAASKVQSKASRMKKPKVTVASSLRLNKKVSSLVDKWKAAKEELQEQEEEEQETPLDILEKKRRREIEVWRAQQIASGEAKENANFQPLGGDWRERVKRRRSQKVAALRTSSDIVDDENKQPDTCALAKDLPPGWQAHWDDSSSQVYYSNSLTSETTWSRPTR